MAEEQEKAPEEQVEEEKPAEEKAEEKVEEQAKEEKSVEEKPKEEKAAEEKPKEEKPAGEAAAQDSTLSKKNKKINRLTVDELNAKIKELENANQTKSKYFKHLLHRKEELQPRDEVAV